MAEKTNRDIVVAGGGKDSRVALDRKALDHNSVIAAAGKHQHISGNAGVGDGNAVVTASGKQIDIVLNNRGLNDDVVIARGTDDGQFIVNGNGMERQKVVAASSKDNRIPIDEQRRARDKAIVAAAKVDKQTADSRITGEANLGIAIDRRSGQTIQYDFAAIESQIDFVVIGIARHDQVVSDEHRQNVAGKQTAFFQLFNKQRSGRGGVTCGIAHAGGKTHDQFSFCSRFKFLRGIIAGYSSSGISAGGTAYFSYRVASRFPKLAIGRYDRKLTRNCDGKGLQMSKQYLPVSF